MSKRMILPFHPIPRCDGCAYQAFAKVRRKGKGQIGVWFCQKDYTPLPPLRVCWKWEPREGIA